MYGIMTMHTHTSGLSTTDQEDACLMHLKLRNWKSGPLQHNSNHPSAPYLPVRPCVAQIHCTAVPIHHAQQTEVIFISLNIAVVECITNLLSTSLEHTGPVLAIARSLGWRGRTRVLRRSIPWSAASTRGCVTTSSCGRSCPA